MRKLFLGMAIAAALLSTSARTETINCTEITAIPIIITVQGVYCLKSNKTSNFTTGNMIDIQTNNVTIDMNGFKLGGLAAGAATNAIGIRAINRKNITIRNGSIRGFQIGVLLQQTTGPSSGHLVEDLLFDQNRQTGVAVHGIGNVIRNNRVLNTGPGDVSNQAFGIGIDFARNTVIANNIVSGTSETIVANAIFVGLGRQIEIRGNTILDTKDANTTRGIIIASSTDVTVIDNRFLNASGTGTFGVRASTSSTGVNCIGNTIAGFTTALSGCDFLAGNNLVP